MSEVIGGGAVFVAAGRLGPASAGCLVRIARGPVRKEIGGGVV